MTWLMVHQSARILSKPASYSSSSYFFPIMNWPHRLLPFVLLASCVPLSRDPLSVVRSQARERLGYDVTAPVTAQDSAAVSASVHALLRRPLTANSAAQIALLNNRRLRATLEDVGISQAELVEASTPSNPILHGRPRWVSPGGLPNAELGLESELVALLMVPLQKRIAGSKLVQTERRVSHEILQLAAEAKHAWFSVLAGEQHLRKLQGISLVNESVSDFAKRVHDAGNINNLELMELQVGGQQVQADIRRERTELATRRAKLNRVLGLSGAQTQWRLATTELPALPATDPSLVSAEAAALSRRQDLAAAKTHVTAIAGALAMKRRTRFIPGLEFGVDTEHDPNGSQLTGPEFRIGLPIFNWGRAAVRKLEGELRQAQAAAEAIEAELRNDVAASHATMRLAREAAEYQQATLLPQRRSILKETLLQYNAMQKGNVALLRAKEEEQRAEKEALDSLRDYWLARVELEKAAGGSLSTRIGGSSSPATATPKNSPASSGSHHQH
jgi:outer membrane protein, heavy metal efflux system